MHILPGVRIIDLALLFEKESILCFSDTHIGYEDSLAKQGLMMPKQQFELTLKRLEKILDKAGPVETILINGDIKDDFGEITDAEWRELKQLFGFLDTKANNIILIKGNHDTFLPPIAKKFEITLLEKYEQGEFCFIHGDILPDTKKRVIIIGHEHPALTMRDGSRRESFKCFLLGKYKKHELIVLPSFNQITEGHDILDGDRQSPLLENIDSFDVFVAGDEPLAFGKVRDLKKRFAQR